MDKRLLATSLKDIIDTNIFFFIVLSPVVRALCSSQCTEFGGGLELLVFGITYRGASLGINEKPGALTITRSSLNELCVACILRRRAVSNTFFLLMAIRALVIDFYSLFRK
jgi:hypothetical protein